MPSTCNHPFTPHRNRTMKHIAIYCVNYQSYESLGNYLNSIDTAMEGINGSMKLSVLVADNTTPAVAIDYQPRHFVLKIFPTGENKGYFGAIRFLMETVNPQDFEYSVVSNVDVLMEKDFFMKLYRLTTDIQIGWIAPQIYSYAEQRDRNPKIMHRYVRRKLQVMRMLFRCPPLYNLYTHSVYKSKKLVHHDPGEIYAGHGSFIILTQQYFRRCGIIDYPVFLFCEEIYLGEQCCQHGLKVIYDPTLRVTDAEHASTSTFKRSKYCQYNYKALSYILDTYYQTMH